MRMRYARFASLVALLLTAGSNQATEDIPTIPLHVALISERSEAAEAFTPEAIQWLADSLNQEFHGGDGTALARFKVEKITQVDEVRQTSPEYLAIGSFNDFSAIRNEALKSTLFRKDAFNVFIYFNSQGKNRSYGGHHSFGKKTNGKRQADYYGWMFYDYKALRKRKDWVLLHEMGHGFGLKHVKPVAGEQDGAKKNVMTASEDSPVTLPPGETGYYFTPSQTGIINKNIAAILETFKRVANSEPLIGPK